MMTAEQPTSVSAKLLMQESIAVTQNYVSSANLQHVLDFLKGGRTELVSGCPFEQRGRLHDAFLSALRQQRPQVYCGTPHAVVMQHECIVS